MLTVFLLWGFEFPFHFMAKFDFLQSLTYSIEKWIIFNVDQNEFRRWFLDIQPFTLWFETKVHDWTNIIAFVFGKS